MKHCISAGAGPVLLLTGSIQLRTPGYSADAVPHDGGFEPGAFMAFEEKDKPVAAGAGV